MVEGELITMRHLLIAHQTASSEALRHHVVALAHEDQDAEFVLVIPATPVDHLRSWTEGEAVRAATEAGDRATAAFAADGITLTDVRVGDGNPVYAIQDAFIVEDFDDVIISTHPSGVSRWLRMDLVAKATRALDVPVIHVESET